MSRTSKYYIPRPRKTPEERFWSKVDKSGDCWIWTGYRNLSDYGTFWYDEKVQKAHRVSWQLEFGPIPDWALVCHKCDNPPCVNPEHLFLGSHMDNLRDSQAKGRRNVLKGNAHWKHKGIKSVRIGKLDLTSVKTIDLTSLIPVYEMVFEPDLPPKQKSYDAGLFDITMNAGIGLTIDTISGKRVYDTASVVGVTIDKALQMDAEDSQALADALSALPQQCGQCGHDRVDHWADEDGYSGCGNDCACKEYEQC